MLQYTKYQRIYKLEFISLIVKNDLFIFVSSVSGILGLIVALVVNSKVTKIKKYVDNSKEVNQKNSFGKNEASING
jgi:hypothetical protein